MEVGAREGDGPAGGMQVVLDRVGRGRRRVERRN